MSDFEAPRNMSKLSIAAVAKIKTTCRGSLDRDTKEPDQRDIANQESGRAVTDTDSNMRSKIASPHEGEVEEGADVAKAPEVDDTCLSAHGENEPIPTENKLKKVAGHVGAKIQILKTMNESSEDQTQIDGRGAKSVNILEADEQPESPVNKEEKTTNELKSPSTRRKPKRRPTPWPIRGRSPFKNRNREQSPSSPRGNSKDNSPCGRVKDSSQSPSRRGKDWSPSRKAVMKAITIPLMRIFNSNKATKEVAEEEGAAEGNAVAEAMVASVD